MCKGCIVYHLKCADVCVCVCVLSAIYYSVIYPDSSNIWVFCTKTFKLLLKQVNLI